jgi:ribosomal 50S subunit-recycling heat shock protein
VALIPVVKHPYFRYNSNVRLDVFLKTSRLIKRRTVAREMCENGRVLVNGSEAKPAKEVRPGDIITLKFSSRNIELEVLGVLAASRKTPPEEFYRIISQSRLLKEDL